MPVLAHRDVSVTPLDSSRRDSPAPLAAHAPEIAVYRAAQAA
jgi:hypothetical protein